MASLALDAANNPHISYWDAGFGMGILKYASYNGTSWKIETVDNGGTVGLYSR